MSITYQYIIVYVYLSLRFIWYFKWSGRQDLHLQYRALKAPPLLLGLLPHMTLYSENQIFVSSSSTHINSFAIL